VRQSLEIECEYECEQAKVLKLRTWMHLFRVVVYKEILINGSDEMMMAFEEGTSKTKR